MGAEDQLVGRMLKYCKSSPHVLLGPGDDCALLQTHSSRLQVATTDYLFEGVHFTKEATYFDIGYKAMAVNLSDIAAMAAWPETAFISLGLPKFWKPWQVDELYDGLTQAALPFDVVIAGGDTNVWSGPLCIGVTLLGHPHPKGVVTRKNAKPDDLILVTGKLGGSLNSGRHLKPTARIKEAWKLHTEYQINAMMDLSDGLASDLRRLCQQSLVGAVLDKDAIPIHDDVKGKDRLKRACTDGEDFELLLVMPKEEVQRLDSSVNLDVEIKVIGWISSSSTICWSCGEEMVWEGYQHY